MIGSIAHLTLKPEDMNSLRLCVFAVRQEEYGLCIRYGRWLQYLLPAQRVGT